MLPLRRVVLPVDFSERSVGAARYVGAIAAHCDCDVTLLHVLPPPHYEFSALEVGSAVLNELFAARAKQVRKDLDAFLPEELGGFRVERVLLEGDPARKIVEYAHQQQCGLIVMPTHGYGPFRRFILGSVTAKVLHDADCPIMTGVHLEQAPRREPVAIRTILVALDLGPQSKAVLEWAAQFAARFEAELLIAYVIPCLEAQPGEYFDPDWRAHIEAQSRQRIEALLSESGVSGKVLMEGGDPPKTICSMAQHAKADLVIIGRGSAAGMFGRLRANAYSIIRQSPCPVVSV
ncbi:MAG: universal stress protein [Acidobacteriales bacterium]|nr:universal stress protein [Terriglobales bacterium]